MTIKKPVKEANKSKKKKKPGAKPGTKQTIANAKKASKKSLRKITKYSDKKHPPLLLALTSAGITSITKLSINFGITRDTFYSWIRKHKLFRESYKEGSNLHMDITARDSLKKLIGGFMYNEVMTKTGKSAKKGKFEEKRVTKKLVVPDREAIKYFLNNKTQGEFKDRQEMDITSDGDQLQTFNIVINGKIKEVKNNK